MANEIKLQFQTGNTTYFCLISQSGTIYNGSSFETINSAHWNTYGIPFTESSGTGIYLGNFPSVSGGIYGILIYQKLGGSYATSDPCIASSSFGWDGTYEIGLGNLPSELITAIKADSVLKIPLTNHNLGKYTYDTVSQVLTLLGDDNTTIGTVTLLLNEANIVTSRE